MVQNVFLMAAPFQVPHAGLPDLRPDGWGKSLIGVGMRCSSKIRHK
jgi:hypothetical protein